MQGPNHIHIFSYFYIPKDEVTENLPTDILWCKRKGQEHRKTYCSEGSRSKALMSEFKMLMDMHSTNVESQMTICFVPRACF